MYGNIRQYILKKQTWNLLEWTLLSIILMSVENRIVTFSYSANNCHEGSDFIFCKIERERKGLKSRFFPTDNYTVHSGVIGFLGAFLVVFFLNILLSICVL